MKRKILSSAIGLATLSALTITPVMAQEYYFRYPISGVVGSPPDPCLDPVQCETNISNDLSILNVSFDADEVDLLSFRVVGEGNIDTSQPFSIRLVSSLNELQVDNQYFNIVSGDTVYSDLESIDLSSIYVPNGNLTIIVEAFDTNGDRVYRSTETTMPSDDSVSSMSISQLGILASQNMYFHEIGFTHNFDNMDTSLPFSFEVRTYSLSNGERVYRDNNPFTVIGEMEYDENGELVNVTSTNNVNSYSGITLSLDVGDLVLTKDAEFTEVTVSGYDLNGEEVVATRSILNSVPLNNLWYKYLPYPGESCDTNELLRTYEVLWSPYATKDFCVPIFIDYQTVQDNDAGSFGSCDLEGYNYVHPEDSSYIYSYESGSGFYDACVLDEYYEEPMEPNSFWIGSVSIEEQMVDFTLTHNESDQWSTYIDIDYSSPIEIKLITSEGEISESEYYTGSGQFFSYDISSIYVNNEQLRIEVSGKDIYGSDVTGAIQNLATEMPEIIEDEGSGGDFVEVNNLVRDIYIDDFGNTTYITVVMDTAPSGVNSWEQANLKVYYNDYETAVLNGLHIDEVYRDNIISSFSSSWDDVTVSAPDTPTTSISRVKENSASTMVVVEATVVNNDGDMLKHIFSVGI